MVSSFSRERMSVTVLPTDEKSPSDCAELAVIQNSLLAVRDMIG